MPWTSQDDFREALAATIAKSQEDRRLFELLFERWFFRAAEAEAVAREIGESGQGQEGTKRLDIDELRSRAAVYQLSPEQALILKELDDLEFLAGA